MRSHRGIRPVPAAEYANAFELNALQIEKFLGILSACQSNVGRFHLQLLAAQFLIHFDFDGQAVAIPPWDVGGVETGHGLRFDHEVLQALVEGGA